MKYWYRYTLRASCLATWCIITSCLCFLARWIQGCCALYFVLICGRTRNELKFDKECLDAMNVHLWVCYVIIDWCMPSEYLLSSMFYSLDVDLPRDSPFARWSWFCFAYCFCETMKLNEISNKELIRFLFKRCPQSKTLKVQPVASWLNGPEITLFKGKSFLESFQKFHSKLFIFIVKKCNKFPNTCNWNIVSIQQVDYHVRIELCVSLQVH